MPRRAPIPTPQCSKRTARCRKSSSAERCHCSAIYSPRDENPMKRSRVSSVAVVAIVAATGAHGLRGQQRAAVVADLVLRGGKVITVDPQNRIASAVAVVGNRVAAVGTDQEIGQLVGP